MIIDAHVHIGPLNLYGELIKDFYRPGRLKTAITWWDPTRFWHIEDIERDAEQIISDMNNYGVDKSCVFPFIATPVNCKTKKERITYLDWVAEEVKKYPDRLIGFASVNPIGGIKAVKELDYAIEELGFKGLKLALAYNKVKLNDRRVWPVWERAEELDIPVMVHTGFGWTDTPIEWQAPLLLEDIGYEFPELKLIMCHIGYGSSPEDMIWCARMHQNFYVEVSGMPRLGMDYIIRIAQLMKGIGGGGESDLFEKAIYGTDYPWRTPNYINLFKNLPKITKERDLDPHITEEDIEKLLGKNMVDLLKL